MMNSVRAFFILSITLFLSNIVLAQTKVVVIPMFGDDATALEPIAFYSRTNLTTPVIFTVPPGTSDHIRACVMISGTSAQVIFQPIYTYADPAPLLDRSDMLATGILTNGVGTVKATTNSCSGNTSYAATITNVTESGLTLTITGNRAVTLNLLATGIADNCVAFISDEDLCPLP